MQEVICINVGQAGVQIANASWELLCIEHDIEANGMLKPSNSFEDNQGFTTFFYETPSGQYIPRTLSVDLEPSVIDEVRTGSYRKFFHPDQLLNIFEDGSSNFARAHYSIGRLLIDRVLDILRKMVEACDGLQGVFLLHSHGGGTGSGFTSLMLKNLNLEFSKFSKLQLSVFPSQVMASSVVEPYNCVLSSISDIEQSDITTIVNNEAIFKICKDNLDIKQPSYTNINRILSHVFSDLTVSLRFENSLTSNLCQMSINLIPYPRIHFPLVCHAPLIPPNKADHETLSTQQITQSVFNGSSQLLTCACQSGLFMSCVMQYRGNVSPKDVDKAIFDIKRQEHIKFVDWCPTGFKIGVNALTRVTVPHSEIAQTERSLTMISNTTAITDPMKRILTNFLILFNKRSFVHWFVGEGMEEGEFFEAKDEMESLVLDFTELSTIDDITSLSNIDRKVSPLPEKTEEMNEEDVKTDSEIERRESELLDKIVFSKETITPSAGKSDSTKKTSEEKTSNSENNS